MLHLSVRFSLKGVDDTGRPFILFLCDAIKSIIFKIKRLKLVEDHHSQGSVYQYHRCVILIDRTLTMMDFCKSTYQGNCSAWAKQSGSLMEPTIR